MIVGQEKNKKGGGVLAFITSPLNAIDTLG